MRTTLFALRSIPDHPGLAYDVWAPVEASATEPGKVATDLRDSWLGRIAALQAPPDYAHFFAAWRAGFDPASTFFLELEAETRLLIGHGNPSPSDVGLTLHHTWGVPVLPGSAVKGLASAWFDLGFGPDDRTVDPHDPTHPEPDRAPWAGVSFAGKRIVRGPGAAYRALFGAPDADEDSGSEPWKQNLRLGAQKGSVHFHDALFVRDGSPHSPLLPDVLTVHQKDWYDAIIQNRLADDSLPSDYDSPNPVSFLTVRPGCRFLLPISGPREHVQVVVDQLKQALPSWGLGAKTARGYGRFKVGKTFKPVTADTPPADDPLLDEVRAFASDHVRRSTPAKEKFAEFQALYWQRAAAASPEVKRAIWQVFGSSIKANRCADERNAIKQLLGIE